LWCYLTGESLQQAIVGVLERAELAKLCRRAAEACLEHG